MFSIFKKAKKNADDKTRYLSVMTDASEARQRAIVLVEVRSRMVAMPEGEGRDHVVGQIDEHLCSVLRKLGETEFTSLPEKEYYKIVAAQVKKSLEV